MEAPGATAPRSSVLFRATALQRFCPSTQTASISRAAKFFDAKTSSSFGCALESCLRSRDAGDHIGKLRLLGHAPTAAAHFATVTQSAGFKSFSRGIAGGHSRTDQFSLTSRNFRGSLHFVGRVRPPKRPFRQYLARHQSSRYGLGKRTADRKSELVHGRQFVRLQLRMRVPSRDPGRPDPLLRRRLGIVHHGDEKF